MIFVDIESLISGKFLLRKINQTVSFDLSFAALWHHIVR